MERYYEFKKMLEFKKPANISIVKIDKGPIDPKEKVIRYELDVFQQMFPEKKVASYEMLARMLFIEHQNRDRYLRVPDGIVKDELKWPACESLWIKLGSIDSKKRCQVLFHENIACERYPMSPYVEVIDSLHMFRPRPVKIDELAQSFNRNNQYTDLLFGRLFETDEWVEFPEEIIKSNGLPAMVRYTGRAEPMKEIGKTFPNQ